MHNNGRRIEIFTHLLGMSLQAGIIICFSRILFFHVDDSRYVYMFEPSFTTLIYEKSLLQLQIARWFHVRNIITFVVEGFSSLSANLQPL